MRKLLRRLPSPGPAGSPQLPSHLPSYSPSPGKGPAIPATPAAFGHGLPVADPLFDPPSASQVHPEKAPPPSIPDSTKKPRYRFGKTPFLAALTVLVTLAAVLAGVAILRRGTPAAPPGDREPVPIWRVPAGAPDTAPLLPGPEGVYAVSGQRLLSAFNWERGRRRWSYEAPSPLWPQSLALAGRVLLAGARGGWVLGLDARSGREIWRQKVEGEPVWAAAAEGDSVFLATSFAGPGLDGRGRARVYRLESDTGRVIWARETQAFGLTTPAAGGKVLLVGGGIYPETAPSSPSLAEPPASSLLSTPHTRIRSASSPATSSIIPPAPPLLSAPARPLPKGEEDEEGGHSFLAALDAESGEILWQRAFRNGFIRYLASRGDLGFYLAYEDRVCAVSLQGGETRWCHDPGNWITGIQVSGSLLYIGSANGFLVALETESGRVLWRHDLPGVFNYPLGPPALAGQDRVAFNTTGGEMYVLEASSGRLRGRLAVPRSRAPLVAWGSKAALPSPEGEVWAYSLP